MLLLVVWWALWQLAPAAVRLPATPASCVLTVHHTAPRSDCLGHIKYFDGVVNNAKGEPIVIRKAICMHEEDAGLLWKHTGAAAVVCGAAAQQRPRGLGRDCSGHLECLW